MKILLLLFVSLFVCGCAGTVMQSLSVRHEEDESRLLTKEQFMERVAQSASIIYEGLRAISEAAEQYAVDHDGRLPQGTDSVVRSLLLDEGYLKSWPVVPAFAFTEANERHSDFIYLPKFDDLDGSGARDDVIFVQDLKIEVCEEFSRRYSDFSPDVIIHDYEAEKENYPAEVFGRHIKIFAISYSMSESPDYCEVTWVLKYNVPPRPKLGT